MYDIDKKVYKQRRKDALSKWVKIEWWNGRTKKVEFEGQILECLKQRSINIQLRGNHYIINNTCGSMWCRTVLPYTDPWTHGFVLMIADQILIQLNYLGDKSQVSIGNCVFGNKKR